MKKVNFQKPFLLGLVFGLVGLLYSCGGEDPDPVAAPQADFSFSLSGKTVTFTNATVGEGVTYAWDFGDGGNSTEAAPSHTYDANGSYIVKLTATNEGGTDDSEKALEVINITIDGDVSDWDDVPALATYTDGVAGTVLEVKVENLEDDKLFIYIKTTEASNGFIDMYINSDGNTATGFSSWLFPATPGFDILLEGFNHPQTAIESELFWGKYDDETAGDDHTAWAWTQLTPSATFFSVADPATVSGGKAYEFAISLSEFPAGFVPTDAISFFIVDVDAPDGGATDWSWLGTAPGSYGEETSAALSYTLK